MQYWLLKTEPGSYSIDDLKRDKKTSWTGVRNYQARNFMRAMSVGDQVFIYHSSTEPIGIVGVARIVRSAYPDPTQFDPKDSHYDPKATNKNPIWDTVEVQFVKKYTEPILLTTLKLDPFFNTMVLTQRGSRLSVQPVSEKHWKKLVLQK